MTKESIKKILQYTNSESIPLAILGVIEGIVECHQQGQYTWSFEALDDVTYAIEALKELRDDSWNTLIKEPQLSDE